MVGIRTSTDPRVWLTDPDMLATALEVLAQADNDEQEREEVD